MYTLPTADAASRFVKIFPSVIAARPAATPTPNGTSC